MPKSARSRRKRQVFQTFLNLFPNLTARENIAVAPRRLLGLSRTEADARAETLLARVQLVGVASSSAWRLRVRWRWNQC